MAHCTVAGRNSSYLNVMSSTECGKWKLRFWNYEAGRVANTLNTIFIYPRVTSLNDEMVLHFGLSPFLPVTTQREKQG